MHRGDGGYVMCAKECPTLPVDYKLTVKLCAKECPMLPVDYKQVVVVCLSARKVPKLPGD